MASRTLASSDSKRESSGWSTAGFCSSKGAHQSSNKGLVSSKAPAAALQSPQDPPLCQGLPQQAHTLTSMPSASATAALSREVRAAKLSTQELWTGQQPAASPGQTTTMLLLLFPLHTQQAHKRCQPPKAPETEASRPWWPLCGLGVSAGHECNSLCPALVEQANQCCSKGYHSPEREVEEGPGRGLAQGWREGPARGVTRRDRCVTQQLPQEGPPRQLPQEGPPVPSLP